MSEIKSMLPNSIKQAREMIANGELTVSGLVNEYLKNIKDKNGDINAYLEIFEDVIDQAKELDGKIGEMENKPLFGIPFSIKDNILISGKICSAGSKMLENYKAVYNATVIEKLKDAGAVIIGRVNMDEFAMGASTENSAFGVTKNPHDLSRVSGGSSGGSAASVAADMCLASLGSDTGGSIRQPAAFCGAVGVSPTYGSVSRYGLIAMASSFDQIGPIAKSVEDAEIIFNVIKGADKMDSTSVLGEGKGKKENTLPEKLKIGILKYNKTGVSDEINKTVEAAAEKLKNLGHEITDIEIPNIDYSVPCYYVLVPAEVSSNLARFDGVRYGLYAEGSNLTDDYMKTRGKGFGAEVKRRIMLGTYVLSAGYYDNYYLKAQKAREIIKQDFKKAFESVDAIISPATANTAFKIGEKSDNPLAMYLEDLFTAPSKVAGLPAISVPFGAGEGGLPIGVQFTAPWFREDILFKIGKELEK
ncbi:TPA: Asp-tRNA(Asn)/Glu-tRNA(Gln) amidotransferase GatCAB subunit A [Patescibacteria group bacterium]|nr:MAG: Glutamyl-tRNA(Gln) amidotransferase subunit A [Parcubacteria group bacterium GW2011_GWF2_40_10]KKR47823.1 MAG: Glutamyl-tRNA(Gln) amidotransferase subunit A [Parcubacteria group bacterium GW2011_GWA2_40_143]KKR60254.1 MAG: Glutamyl-tRNA(Gln) amidotransferase subunit A [Parcubacteria group bacterium GW2011_GWC2_40_31]KKR74489.1 MAG: Glutamyl-tRNA(Gln) amidotransferase subunit A [Parcubacteria group bacterium GW2011_GWB2_40_8]KKR77402.1 MAG: Glutamyl-tRNA(Gln) amidotransferase subunit A [